MRWGLGRAWRCWAEVKESARAFESDLDGGGGRSSSGDGGARMTRGRGLTEAGDVKNSAIADLLGYACNYTW